MKQRKPDTTLNQWYRAFFLAIVLCPVVIPTASAVSLPTPRRLLPDLFYSRAADSPPN